MRQAFPLGFYSMQDVWRRLEELAQASNAVLWRAPTQPTLAADLPDWHEAFHPQCGAILPWPRPAAHPEGLIIAGCVQGAAKGLPGGEAKKMTRIRRPLSLLIFRRCDVSLPKDEKIDTRHFMRALAVCQKDPARAAILQETLEYLERARADFPDYNRVRFRTKGFLEQGDPPPSEPDKLSSSLNKDAYSRTCQWVEDNLKTLQSLDMHSIMY